METLGSFACFGVARESAASKCANVQTPNLSRGIVHNVLGLGVVGDLEAQMLNKPQMLIKVQMLNSALLPLFG